MHRRSLLLAAPRQLEWIAEDLPPLQSSEVLLQTIAGAISIGSELPQYGGTARSSTPATYPRMTGYESLGIIIACGSAVRRLHVGDRVVTFYGHRTHGIVPETRAIAVPKDVSNGLALLVILTCDVSKGLRKIGELDDHVLITGAGTIGLLTVFMVKHFAGDDIVIDVVEPRAERRALALRLGARTALSPQEMLQRNDTYTQAFECSSYNAAFALLQSKMQREGRICILADGNFEPLVLAPAFHEKELQVIASSDGWDYQEHAKWYFNLVRKDSHNLEQVFDYCTTANDLIATFERIATSAITPTKVLVQYDTFLESAG